MLQLLCSSVLVSSLNYIQYLHLNLCSRSAQSMVCLLHQDKWWASHIYMCIIFTLVHLASCFSWFVLSIQHGTKKPVTTMLTYPWKCTVLHCNHLGNTWKPLVLMTRHFDYCPSASESSAPVVSRCFPGGYNVKLYISRGRLAWWLLAFLHSASTQNT